MTFGCLTAVGAAAVTSDCLTAVGAAAVFYVHVLLWTAQCILTQLRLDIDPARRRWLWHWRSATVVSICC